MHRHKHAGKHTCTDIHMHTQTHMSKYMVSDPGIHVTTYTHTCMWSTRAKRCVHMNTHLHTGLHLVVLLVG